MVRGTITLPHGSGKQSRVVVVSKDEKSADKETSSTETTKKDEKKTDSLKVESKKENLEDKK